jgi:hypothetical protein
MPHCTHEVPEAQRSGNGCMCAANRPGVSHGRLRSEPGLLLFGQRL